MLTPNNRVIMLSGASRGLGLAIAQRLSTLGYHLSIGTLDADRAEWLAVESQSLSHLVEEVDIRDPAQCERWVQHTADHFKQIDGLINNAGVVYPTTLEDDQEDKINDMFQVNAIAPLRLTRLALPFLRQSGVGRVVNIVSMAAHRIQTPAVGYAMSKAAMLAFTHALRKYEWDNGIRATAICPALLNTEMATNLMTRRGINPADVIQVDDLAEMVSNVLAMPNNATVGELLVNWKYEDTV